MRRVAVRFAMLNKMRARRGEVAKVESTLFRDRAQQNGPRRAVELEDNHRQRIVDARAIKSYIL